MIDKEIKKYIKLEEKRQKNTIDLIASENYVSKVIRKVCGSVLTNKYAEGYPGHRYYGGCENVDEIEKIAIREACDLFNCKYANVQPHSGTQANMAVYASLLDIGDTILSPSLNSGGHLTHSSPVSFVSKLYKVITYDVDNIGYIDYKQIEELALKYKPKLIVGGFSAYPRKYDLKEYRRIADSVGAYLMIDMAHIAGIVAGGFCPNPCRYADVVTSTTHKTLRGPRGGLILTNRDDLISKINKSVFPYTQGGPLEHIIAGKAICFKEAKTIDFKRYISNVLWNSNIMARTFNDLGCALSTNGTDNHLIILNTKLTYGLTGKEAEEILAKYNIVVNKNMVPFDTEKPSVTSGIRIGTPAITTRGFNANDCMELARIIDYILCEYIKEENGIVKDDKILTKSNKTNKVLTKTYREKYLRKRIKRLIRKHKRGDIYG